MLKGQLLHPALLNVLGRAGHGSQLLIADGNFPFLSALGPRAELINLNLSPGVVTCTQVLDALLSAVPIEAAAVMDYLREGPYALDATPPIWAEFEQSLRGAGFDSPLAKIERFAFYEAAQQSQVVATIATGEQRIYANLLLTIGVVMPDH